MKKNNKSKLFAFRLPVILSEDFKTICKKNKTSYSKILQDAVSNYIIKNSKQIKQKQNGTNN